MDCISISFSGHWFFLNLPPPIIGISPGVQSYIPNFQEHVECILVEIVLVDSIPYHDVSQYQAQKMLPQDLSSQNV
jgi:hypothetical protein